MTDISAHPLYVDMFTALLPSGPAWNQDSDGTLILDQLVRALTLDAARVRGDAGQFLEDFLPDTTTAFLADWERLLGLPDCGLPLGTLDDRRAAVIARLRRRGDPTLVNIQALADTFGNGAVITYGVAGGTLFRMGVNAMGDPLGSDAYSSSLTITYNSPQSDAFECTMRHAIPVHIVITFVVV